MRLVAALGCFCIMSSLTASPQTATLRAVQFVDEREGWAVGDQGIILHSIDSGKTWERQPSGSTASLRGLHFLSPYVGYVVGRNELPNRVGSAGVILMTTDGGATWRELTSTTLPGLSVVRFFNEQHGLVAGEPTPMFPSGVFTTDNGGLTWKGSRDTVNLSSHWKSFHSGSHEAFSLVTETHERADFVRGELKTIEHLQEAPPVLPTGTQARFDLNDKLGWCVGAFGNIHRTSDGGRTWTLQRSGGQRLALLCVHLNAESVPYPLIALAGAKEGYLCGAVTCLPNEEARLSQALASVGGCVGLRGVGLPGSKQFDRVDPTTVQHLAKILREYRPEVVLTDSGMTPEEKWLQRCLEQAIRVAADANAQLGMTPHTVKRVWYLDPQGELQIDLTIDHPELGGCLKDYSKAAQRLYSTRPGPNRLGFKLASPQSGESLKSLFTGIELAEGGTARRKKAETTPLPAAQAAQLEASSKLRRELETLFDEPMSRDKVEPTLVKCLESLRKVPESTVPSLAVDLGFCFVQAGQWTAARELFAGVAEYHAAHPDAADALRWLVQYHSSAEVRRRLERGDFPIFQRAAFTPIEDNLIQQVAGIEGLLPRPALKFSNAEAVRQWHQAGLDLQPKLAAFGSAYQLDPSTVLALTAARRNLGLHGRALESLKALVPHDQTSNLIRARLIAERCLLDDKPLPVSDPHQQNPMPLEVVPQLRSVAIKSKPLLDGRLDDVCWQTVKPTELSSSMNTYGTRVMFRHDEQFLYVAVICEHPEGKAMAKVARRDHDADLSGYDRVELTLDLDRDYQTAYKLCVDQRGLVHDECWGDASWNPKWFVAVEPGATGWICELAIPFSELTDRAPKPGSVWAAEARRVVPGQCEATTGFGHLKFLGE